MGQSTWRKIVKSLTVPEREGVIWTRALDYVTANKLYLITVDPEETGGKIADQLWTPEASQKCTADGNPALKREEDCMLADCSAGALIARIGGSSANQKLDATKVTMFSVGRHCVFSVSDATKVGSLYLGMNDTQKSMAKIGESLRVTISEGL